MSFPAALLDTNVVVSSLIEGHQHHANSIALLAAPGSERPFAVAAHSIAEAFATLTRRGELAAAQFDPQKAWAALESLSAAIAILGLTPAQTLDAVRRYAVSGGIGARLYDALIGEVALVHGIGSIITWNTRHMTGLFPGLRVVTPIAYVAKPGYTL